MKIRTPKRRTASSPRCNVAEAVKRQNLGVQIKKRFNWKNRRYEYSSPHFQTQKVLDCTAKANDGFISGIRTPIHQASTDEESGTSTKSPYKKLRATGKKIHERQVVRKKRDRISAKPTGNMTNSEDKVDLIFLSLLKSEQLNKSPVVVITTAVNLAHAHEKLSLNKPLRSAIDKDTVVKRAPPSKTKSALNPVE